MTDQPTTIPTGLPPTGTLPVAELTARILPAYGASWADAFDGLLSSPADADIVATLRPAAAAGALRRPVWVTPDDDTGQLRVANGMHRVTACHLEGAAVPYAISADWLDRPAGTVEVEAVFTVADTCGRADDDYFEAVFDWLRSFPAGDAWVETSGMASSRDEFSAWYLLPDRLVAELPDLLAARLAPHGLTITRIRIQPADTGD